MGNIITNIQSKWLYKPFSIQPKIWVIFALGFSSGVPFLLILSTLHVWLVEQGISKMQIGLFAWVTVAYTFKFILAPLLDVIRMPILENYMGRRRSWLLASQIMLILSLMALGFTNPQHNIMATVIAAFFVGVFSAIQDIAVESYRVEILGKLRLGIGASASVLGYRLGMIFSGAGALYLASYINNWHLVYCIMALSIFVGVIATILSKDPDEMYTAKNIEGRFSYSVIVDPIKKLFLSNNWKTVLVFILCFKMADTVLTVMTMPFLLEIGFNKVQIAHVSKTFGISAMIIGGIFGGIYLQKHKLLDFLYICCVLQIVSSLFFVLQAFYGKNVGLLFLTLGFENFTTGLAQVGLITYFLHLCIRSHSSAFYAILTSFASFVRVNGSVLAGYIADNMSWFEFYLLASIICIPSMVLLKSFAEHFACDQQPSSKIL